MEITGGYNGYRGMIHESRLGRMEFSNQKCDAIAKSRHTRESGYPGFKQAIEIPGFPFSRE